MSGIEPTRSSPPRLLEPDVFFDSEEEEFSEAVEYEGLPLALEELIHETLAPQIVAMMPTMAGNIEPFGSPFANYALGTIAKYVASAAQYVASERIQKEVEKRLQKIFLNLLKKVCQEKGLSLKATPDAELIKQLLDYLASFINRPREKEGELNGKLFERLTNEVLAAAFPQGAEDLELGRLNTFVLSKIQESLPTVLFGIAKKVQAAAKAKEENIRQVQKHLGAQELIEFIAVASHQFKDVLAKNVTQTKLMDHLGAYSEPISLHILANLAKNKPEGDGTHLLTYIVTHMVENAFAFVAEKKEELEEAVLFSNPLKPIFAPEADRILRRADLEKIIPVGASGISALFKEMIVEKQVRFYLDVIRPLQKKHPLQDRFPHYETEQEILKKLIQGHLSKTKKDLENPETKFGESLFKKLFEAFFILDKSYERFNAPVAAIFHNPCVGKIFDLGEQYLRHNLTTLLGNLSRFAKTHTPGSNLSIEEGAFELVEICKKAAGSDLTEKLNRWKRLPEETDQQKKIKEKEKKRLMRECFIPATEQILDRGGFYQDENFLVPFEKTALRNDLTNSFLPNLFFDMACNILVPKALTEAESLKFFTLKGTDRLEALGEKISLELENALMPAINDLLPQMGMLLNENSAEGRLTTAEEIALARKAKKLMSGATIGTAFAKPFIENFLIRLACKGEEGGDALINIVHHLRKRAQEANIDDRFIHRLKRYEKETAPLRKIEGELEELLKQALENEAPQLISQKKEQLREEREKIDKANQLRASANRRRFISLEKKRQRLLKKLEPFMTALLKDGGIENKDDLPIPSEALFKCLKENILPSLGIKAYLFANSAFNETKEHRKNLRDRLGNDNLANALEKYGAYALKCADNYAVVNTDEVLQKLGATAVVVAKGAKNLGEAGKVEPKPTEFLLPMVQKEVVGQLLDFFDGLTKNLKGLEAGNPTHSLNMVLGLVSQLTRHLNLVKAVQQGGEMSQANPTALHKAFEAQHELAAGMPSFAIIEQKKLIAELEHTTEENKKGLLDKERRHLANLIEQAHREFNRDFTLWLLNLAGKKSHKDLKVPPEYSEMVWKQLTENIGPSVVESVLSTLAEQDTIDLVLVSLLENLNQALQKPAVAPASPPTPSDPQMVKQMHDLLEAIGGAFPSTLLSKLKVLQALPFVGNIPAEKLEQALQGFAKEWTLSKILETALVQGAANLPQNTLPVTKEELEAADLEKVQNRKKQEQSLQDLAAKPVQQKRDQILHSLDNTWWDTLLGFILRPLIFWLFSHLEKKVKKDIIVLRDNIAKTPIHANLAYKYLGDMKGHYPILNEKARKVLIR